MSDTKEQAAKEFQATLIGDGNSRYYMAISTAANDDPRALGLHVRMHEPR